VVNRRLAAITSLVLLAASVVVAVVLGVESFPRGLSVLACLVAALLAAWWALIHRGAARFAAAAGAGVLLVGAVVLVAVEGRVLEDALVLAGVVLSVAAARRVFSVRATLPAASAPKRPVLFYNPKSGGGKAERFEVARLDAGVLGIAVLQAGAARNGDKRVQQWSAPSFEVSSAGPVAAGIDGEALSSNPRCAFAPGHKPCACGSRRNTQAPHHPRTCRKARGARSARSPTSPRTALPSYTRL
jgi:hypothetical protein